MLFPTFDTDDSLKNRRMLGVPHFSYDSSRAARLSKSAICFDFGESLASLYIQISHFLLPLD